jgi:hypothetical protein
MIYKVTVNNNNKKIKAVVKSDINMARKLEELLDVDVSGVSDKYVLMYDSVTKKYRAVNPDTVLSAASTTESTQPGLPSNFINQLDNDLEDRVDLDAGSF